MNKIQEIKNYWTLPIEQLFDVLETKTEGLSIAEAKNRLEYLGKNNLIDHSREGVVKVFLSQFLNPLIGILMFAGCVTVYLGEHIETVVIFTSVFINVIFAFYQEYKAENTIEQLKTYIKNRTTVFRDDELRDIDAQELVLGDIVSISAGNRIPADGRLIEATNLYVDESILTGESVPVKKNTDINNNNQIAERKNSVFCGTYVSQGVALMVVTATGDRTEIGKIAQNVTKTKRVQTPVQHAVKQISWYIFILVLFVVVFVFLLGIYRGENLFDMLVLASAIAVGAVPEALPITLTVILSVGVLSISKKGGLIRKLSAAETLGSTTLILTDKTGTLTKAELSLDSIYSASDLITKDIVLNSPLNTLTKEQQECIYLAYLNNKATVEKVGANYQNWVYSGSAFDVVILKSMYRFGIDTTNKVHGNLIVPFDSVHKYSVYKEGAETFILGAPDVLIKHSSLSIEEQALALAKITAFAEEGKRIIALGRRHADDAPELIQGLSLVSIFVFSDPLREDVVVAIADIMSKGVAVKIITGDMMGTARSIARLVGINATDREILTGDELKALSDEQLKELLPHIKIFARTTPEDKMRVGNLYRSLGETVSMTGDGVNDAPALKAMDIGISLGSGSDVAKSASDMVLLDNNFKTITDAIIEGYKIRSRIRKVFVYLMSSSLDEVFVIAGSLIAGLALPISALQIIWVNILTGTLPAIAFAYDSYFTVEKNQKHNKIFNFKTKFMSLGIGTLSSVLLFVLYYTLVKMIPDAGVVRSVFFACFATYILTISYSFRNLEKFIWEYNPFSNKRLNSAVLIGLVCIVLTVTLPFALTVFNTSAIPFSYLWIIITWNVLNLIIIEATKLFIKKVNHLF